MKTIPGNLRLVAPIPWGEAYMVNGRRYLNGNKKDTPIYRRVGQKVLDTATSLDSGLKVIDSQSGFRAPFPGLPKIFSASGRVAWPLRVRCWRMQLWQTRALKR